MTLTHGAKMKALLRKLVLVSAALVVTVPASAAVRFRGGLFYGPAFGPWNYWYGPYFYGPYPVVEHPHAGQIKLDTKVKEAEVYIDGAYAGTAGELKSMWLRQGTYNLEVRSPDGTPFQQKIYVVTGKTTHVRPEWSAPEPNGAAPKS